ncbi:hypothetical protein G6F50_015080 [Rhizopus delemar]|uniref:Uncharacterized protein n=1 Tax=Rhizopus delemar TaxID=936053 RepID=A0A9P7C573_9FUNG|nr:hypothetical protein G6F50_015080 [Rhizopus delemar]
MRTGAEAMRLVWSWQNPHWRKATFGVKVAGGAGWRTKAEKLTGRKGPADLAIPTHRPPQNDGRCIVRAGNDVASLLVKNFIQDANPGQRKARRQSHLRAFARVATWAKLQMLLCAARAKADIQRQRQARMLRYSSKTKERRMSLDLRVIAAALGALTGAGPVAGHAGEGVAVPRPRGLAGHPYAPEGGAE